MAADLEARAQEPSASRRADCDVQWVKGSSVALEDRYEGVVDTFV